MSSFQNENAMERDIKAQVDMALKKKDTKPLVESMAKMLLVQDKKSEDTKPKMGTVGHQKNNKGIIIDWLQKIDPELKQVDVDLRYKLLFNRNPHLLTVFSHLSNWDHLKGGFQFLDLIITELKSHITC